MTKETKLIPIEAIDWELPLDQLLKVLVAKVDGVSPDQVTNEYVRAQYEKGFASDLRYDQGSQYGGYSTVGLKFRSKDELDEVAAKADALLAR